MIISINNYGYARRIVSAELRRGHKTDDFRWQRCRYNALSDRVRKGVATMEKLDFSSDCLEGCADEIMDRLVATNHEKSAGYGLDEHSIHAQRLIKDACKAPSAEVFFLVGGTQTNEVAISALHAPWEGVIAAASGHIAVHEAGAIEAGGQS